MGKLFISSLIEIKLKIWRVAFFKFFTTEKLWVGLPVFQKYQVHMHVRWPVAWIWLDKELLILHQGNISVQKWPHHSCSYIVTRGPLVLCRSPECWRYAELKQTWKYISTQCCISFHPCRSIQKQIWPCHKNGQGHPRVIVWTHW